MKTIHLYEIEQEIGHPLKVENLSNNSQIIYCQYGSWFVSYGQIIGAYFNGKLALTKLHDYSRTTSKYCTKWCNLNKYERCYQLNKELAYKID